MNTSTATYEGHDMTVNLHKPFTTGMHESTERNTRDRELGQVELNFSPNRWAGNGAPLIAFPQGSVADPHEGHDTVCCQVGAPGIGTCEYCYTCKVYFNDNSRILDPEEVR